MSSRHVLLLLGPNQLITHTLVGPILSWAQVPSANLAIFELIPGSLLIDLSTVRQLTLLAEFIQSWTFGN